MSAPVSWVRLAAAFFLLQSQTLFCQATVPSPAEYSFTVSASESWTNTGVDVSAGDKLEITAESRAGSEKNCNPQGATSSKDSSGALVAKISENGTAVSVAGSREIDAEAAGRLLMRLNQGVNSACAFMVKVTVTHPSSAAGQAGAEPRNVKDQLSSAAKVWLQGQFGGAAAAKTESSTAVSPGREGSTATSSSARALPSVVVDADLRKHIDELPRRVHDHLGNLGDMVNFVVVGSQERVQAALEGGGWHLADVDSKEAGVKAVIDAYEKKDYLEMPMSRLILFDRVQDFGYEQAQAYAVVASRHHFRLWKAPFASGGETVWVGAATHDIGFEKDVRTGKLTHKIDPDVDQERQNLADSLDKSGKVKSITYYLPPNPVEEAKNASGGSYHSDGRLLVVFLK